MKQLKIKDWILIGALSFSLGLSAPYISKWFKGDPSAAPAEQVEGNSAISTSPFCIKLLHTALQAQPQGNMVLLPDSLASNLYYMRHYASDEVAAEIDALELPEHVQQSNAPIYDAAYLFAEDSGIILPRPLPEHLFDTPFSQSPADAIAQVNNAVKSYTNAEIGQLITGDTITPDTAVLSASVVTLSTTLPGAGTTAAPIQFSNANGSMPRIRAFTAYARHFAKDEQGEWQAVAVQLPSVPGADHQLPSCHLILILPSSGTSARPFAAALTAEKLTAIRTALQQSTTACTVEMPSLTFRSPTQNLIPLLRQLGTEKLLSTAAPFPKLSAKAAYPLSNVLQKYNISLLPAAAGNTQPLPTTEKLSCDRPFLWLLMPLASPDAPYAMGVVENL